MNCLWCDIPFKPRQGGKPQRFCSADHRRAFEAALREWARGELEAGRLTVEELKGADCAAYTLHRGPISASAVRHPQTSPYSNASVASEPILAVAGGHVPDRP